MSARNEAHTYREYMLQIDSRNFTFILSSSVPLWSTSSSHQTAVPSDTRWHHSDTWRQRRQRSRGTSIAASKVWTSFACNASCSETHATKYENSYEWFVCFSLCVFRYKLTLDTKELSKSEALAPIICMYASEEDEKVIPWNIDPGIGSTTFVCVQRFLFGHARKRNRKTLVNDFFLF